MDNSSRNSNILYYYKKFDIKKAKKINLKKDKNSKIKNIKIIFILLIILFSSYIFFFKTIIKIPNIFLNENSDKNTFYQKYKSLLDNYKTFNQTIYQEINKLIKENDNLKRNYKPNYAPNDKHKLKEWYNGSYNILKTIYPKNYNFNIKKHFSILTINLLQYEILREPYEKSNEIEYVLITDDPNIISNVWIIKLVERAWFLDIKHNPFAFVSTDTVLWLDGSYQIKKNPNEIMEKFIKSKYSMAISLHETRRTSIIELAAWLVYRNFDMSNAIQFFKQLVNENFYSYTLFQTSVFALKRTPKILEIFEKERELEKKLSVNVPYRDDQTTLSYIIAKYYKDWDELLLLDFSSTSNNKYFDWRAHKSNRVINVKNSNTYCFDKEQKLYRIEK